MTEGSSPPDGAAPLETAAHGRLEIWAPAGIGEVRPGDDLVALIGAVLVVGDDPLRDGDILVVTSKIVSKAEGRVVRASSREAAIDAETVRVVATREHAGGVTRIVENRQGLVMAAAGVDASNTPEGTVLLLPEDPDASARGLRAGLERLLGVRLGVLVSDTSGRAWRQGVTELAIGAAGVVVLEDLRGGRDSHGRLIEATVTATGDEIASAAELVKRKAAGLPVAVVRGLARLVTDEDGPGARSVVRPAAEDMFSLGTAEARAEGFARGIAAVRP